MIILVRESVTGNSWKTPGLVVAVMTLGGCNNYLVQAATFCTVSSLSQLSDFSLSPEPSSPPVTGRPAGWSKTCTNFPLAQNLLVPAPPPLAPPPGPGLPLSCFISYITYHALRPDLLQLVIHLNQTHSPPTSALSTTSHSVWR